jgi:capsular exopolysaccharide synthesis family protein
MLAGAVVMALPTSYIAQTSILLPEAAAIQSETSERSPSQAEQVIADLHLDSDAEFSKPGWEPLSSLHDARNWIEQQTGWKIPILARAGHGDLVDRFWDHIEIARRGRSSRVVEIRASAGDPQQAAAIANALARLRQGSGTIIAPALPPTEPNSPPAMIILLIGAVSGTLTGLLGIILSDAKPRLFSSADEIEGASGLPVIAAIPQLDDGDTAIALVLRDPISPYAESLRKLYEKLHSERWSQTPKIIAISSALPGEGRSTLAASLGRLLASEGGRVLLVDCDWRHPDLHKLFRLGNETGLSSLLLDPHIAIDDVIHTDALSGLDIITAGRRNRQAMHKLVSEPMKQILATLGAGYDLVLLDMPPVLAGDEALPLSGVVDKLIFAVRWRHTLRRRATEAIDKILAARGDVVGVVFTRVDLSRYEKSKGLKNLS